MQGLSQCVQLLKDFRGWMVLQFTELRMWETPVTSTEALKYDITLPDSQLGPHQMPACHENCNTPQLGQIRKKSTAILDNLIHFIHWSDRSFEPKCLFTLRSNICPLWQSKIRPFTSRCMQWWPITLGCLIKWPQCWPIRCVDFDRRGGEKACLWV